MSTMFAELSCYCGSKFESGVIYKCLLAFVAREGLEDEGTATTTLEAGDAMVCEILVVDFKVIMAFAPVFEVNFFVGCLVVLLRT